MGLGRERFNATVEQVQANFKVRSLLLHPDKCGIAQASEEDKEKLEKRFKDLQTAFEVLTDPKRRRDPAASLRTGVHQEQAERSEQGPSTAPEKTELHPKDSQEKPCAEPAAATCQRW